MAGAFRKGHADATRILGDIQTQQHKNSSAQQYYAEAHRVYQMLQDPAADEIANHI